MYTKEIIERKDSIIMEDSHATFSPLLFKNLITSMFVFADKSLLNLGEKYKLLQLLRYLLVSVFILFLRILSLLFSYSPHEKTNYNYKYVPKFSKVEDKISTFENYKGDSSIARALTQLLSIMNSIPVSSRKYEIVRSLADKLIDENLQEGHPALLEVNCVALSEAFTRTLSQLQARAAVLDEDVDHNAGVYGNRVDEAKSGYHKLSRVLRAVWYYGEALWSRLGKSELNRSGKSAEKLTAEVLWLAQKMAKCGSVEQAVDKWASASKLAWLALSAESRLQGSLLKVSGVYL